MDDELKCTYCGKVKPRAEMEQQKIFTRGRDAKGKACVVEKYLWFCKGSPCGGYYQMGCEG